MKKTSHLVAISLTTIMLCGPVFGQDSAEDLAKAAQNPVAAMISVPLQCNINFKIGPFEETQTIMNIQPVLPFSLGENWNLVTRTIVPMISQPNGLTGGDGRVVGLGNITFSAFFSPKNSVKPIWGIGPILMAPTSTSGFIGNQTSPDGRPLGVDKWGIGPSIVVLAMPGKWVVGSLFSNVWSFAGSGDQDVNLFTWQYFINYNLANGWYLTSQPILTANWLAESGEQWVVPFGGGVGKIFKMGKQPMNAQAQAFYNVVTPENGAQWQLRLQLQFLFPK